MNVLVKRYIKVIVINILVGILIINIMFFTLSFLNCVEVCIDFFI